MSENELSPKLNLPHGPRGADPAKRRRAERAAGVAVVDGVERVENLRADLELHRSAQRNVFHQRQVSGGKLGTSEHVARRVAEGELRLKRKCRSVVTIDQFERGGVWLTIERRHRSD